MTELKLVTGGRVYGGWKSIRVTTSIERFCGEFQLDVTELWPGNESSRKIEPFADCEVRIGDVPIITGYVDEVGLSLDERSHAVSISGRDKAADLVDCSAVRKAGQWRGLKIEAIARELAKPFGVAVTADVDTGRALPSFALQEGESVFEAIARAAAYRALLVVSDGHGGIVITRAGTERVNTSIVEGKNLLSGRGSQSVRDRYSIYTAKGQAPGSDYFNGKAASQVQAGVKDPAVPRFRPLILTAECPDVAATLQQRVQWEANVRAARSVDITVSVQGWEHADGLWRTNRIVHVQSPRLRLDHDLLIKGVTYSLDESGTVAQLSLTRADAFTMLALKVKDAAAGFWDAPKPQAGGR